MTPMQGRPVTEVDRWTDRRSPWSRLLVPLLTALLVLVFGLVLVGLTTDGPTSTPGRGSGAVVPVR